ncbi:MAG: GyrI-like domain-containing protein [Salinivirgaceae bacterium]|jgi:effector-binding domain-containing protein|nr:GyrI-like domain-containing protein [Salinivirgaceae bacterium]
MKMKTAPAMTVLAKDIKTSMKSLLNDVGEIPQEIYRNAVENSLHPAGPQYWIYKWVDENPGEGSEFILSICLPVATFGVTHSGSSFVLKQMPRYKHMAEEHLGAWDKLKETYGKLMSEMQKQELQAGNTCREVYIHCDFETPENNVTEVQFEIK